jgi:hypothetical protein
VLGTLISKEIGKEKKKERKKVIRKKVIRKKE